VRVQGGRRTQACIFFLLSQDPPPSAPPSTPPPSTGKKPLLLSKRTGLGLGSQLGQVKSYSHAKQLPVAQRPSVFQSPDEDEEEDYEQWLEIKGKLWGCCPPAGNRASSRRSHSPQGRMARGTGCSWLGSTAAGLWTELRAKAGPRR
jgi:hypothetical protein